MADIGVNYSASIEPSPVNVSLGLSFEGNRLQATIRNVSDFVAVLKPSGNAPETVLSAIVWPIAQTLGATLPTLGKSFVVGKTIDLVTIDDSKQTYSGETFTVGIRNPQLSDFGGMLLIEGDLQLT